MNKKRFKHKTLAVEYGGSAIDVAEVLLNPQYRLHNCIMHIAYCNTLHIAIYCILQYIAYIAYCNILHKLHIAAHIQQSTTSSFRVVVDLVCVGSLSSYVVTGDQAGDSQDVHIGALGGTGPTSKPHQTLNYPTKTSPTIHFITWHCKYIITFVHWAHRNIWRIKTYDKM